MLAQAVRQGAAWLRAGCAMPIAINVSALQFQQPQFVDRVAAVLAPSQPAGAPLLELELTESILVRDADEALQRLHALARIGVRLSIDDFGTGYSSLAYLKRFPIGKLKIDRSFVQGLPGDDSDSAIVVAILQMAGALGMKVIAEGVETEASASFLLDSGCHEFQGFLYAPALDSLSFEKRLQLSRAHAGTRRRRVACAWSAAEPAHARRRVLSAPGFVKSGSNPDPPRCRRSNCSSPSAWAPWNARNRDRRWRWCCPAGGARAGRRAR